MHQRFVARCLLYRENQAFVTGMCSVGVYCTCVYGYWWWGGEEEVLDQKLQSEERGTRGGGQGRRRKVGGGSVSSVKAGVKGRNC